MSDDELSEGWAEAPVADLAAPIANALAIGPFGSNLKVSDYSAGGIPLVFVRDIRAEAFGGSGTRYVSREKGDELAVHVVRPGDLLVTKMGEPPGDTALYPMNRPPAVITSDCIKVSPDSRLCSSVYLKYAFRAETTRQQVIDAARGVAQQKLSLERFRDITIPVAPLAEQDRIVEKVEALLAKVNGVKERLERARYLFKRFRQAVLAAACAGELTKDWRTSAEFEPLERTLRRINVPPSKTGREATNDVIPGIGILSVGDPGREAPSGWKWVPLTRVARLESGHTPSRKHLDYWGGQLPWISLTDARAAHGGVIQATAERITARGVDNSAARPLPAGTVCLSRTASVGYVVVMGKQMATSQDFVNWVCSKALIPDFLRYAILAEGDHILEFGRGTTHTTIYFPEIKAFHICLPPVAEQIEIVRRITSTLPLTDQIARACGAAARRARALSPAILASAFSGALVPTEAELARKEGRAYETADELLERIKRDREAVEARRPQKRKRKGQRASA